jgi:short-subunit dehydrogenase
MSPLSGKTYWLVGASSGIGEALASQLAAQGHFVIASARSGESLAQLALTQPSRIKAVPCDVTQPESLAQAALRIQELTDFLDGMIFCAGTCEYEDRLDFDVDAYQRVMNVNFFGVVRCLALAKPLLQKAQDSPQLLVVSSLSTLLPLPRNEIYGASKAALDYFVEALRVDTSLTRLQITLAKPGFVATPLTAHNDFAMPFIMQPEAAAARVLKAFIAKRARVVFPRRLWLLLQLASFFKPLWLRYVAPRITRIKKW